jgi:hypothetical protein
MVEAERRWKITIEWRRAHGVDGESVSLNLHRPNVSV